MSRNSLLRTKVQHRCHYCNCPLTPGLDLTVDHIVPRALGGTNHHLNLATACEGCNTKKAHSRWHRGCRRCDKAWRRFLLVEVSRDDAC